MEARYSCFIGPERVFRLIEKTCKHIFHLLYKRSHVCEAEIDEREEEESMQNRTGGGGKFAFLDAGDVAKRLGIDRVTLDQWVKEGRIRTHRGVGRDVFFRSGEVEALYKE